jgi:hypothetical protein
MRHKPVKVLITKDIEEGLRKGNFITASDAILRKVDEERNKPKKQATWDHSFADFQNWLLDNGARDQLIVPTHAGYGSAVGRFYTMAGHLQLQQEDVAKIAVAMKRWKMPMALEKFTAILPSMLTEARSNQRQVKTWQPPVWDTEVAHDSGPGDTSDF